MRALLLLCLAGSGCRAVVRGSATPVAAQRVAQEIPGRLETTVAQQCDSCHDGEPGRPNFDGSHAMTAREAMSVGLAVASSLMPPPPRRLAPVIRESILKMACERASPDTPAGACVARLSPLPPRFWLVDSDAQRLLVDEAAGPAAPSVAPTGAAGPEPNPLKLVDPEVRTLRLGVTLMTLRTIYAAQRCGDPSTDEPRYARCLDRALDYAQSALPSKLGGTP